MAVPVFFGFPPFARCLLLVAIIIGGSHGDRHRKNLHAWSQSSRAAAEAVPAARRSRPRSSRRETASCSNRSPRTSTPGSPTWTASPTCRSSRTVRDRHAGRPNQRTSSGELPPRHQRGSSRCCGTNPPRCGIASARPRRPGTTLRCRRWCCTSCGTACRKAAYVTENTERLRIFLSGDLDFLPFDDEDAQSAGRVRADLESRGTPDRPLRPAHRGPGPPARPDRGNRQHRRVPAGYPVSAWVDWTR